MQLVGINRPAFYLYRSFWSVLDLLFPPSCGGCQKPNTRWCSACQSQITRVPDPICKICGDMIDSRSLPVQTGGDLFCKQCQHHPPGFQALRSYGIFDGTLREAIHQLKYKNNVGMGEALSKHLIEIYNQLNWDVDLIVPVPLSAKRIRERGYNQSGLLGRPFAYALQKPYRPDVLYRTRFTRSQVGLNAQERQKNVEAAFAAKGAAVRGKTVLIIDDVATTGSTINACAQALHAAGASAVFGLTLARAASQADADDRPTTS